MKRQHEKETKNFLFSNREKPKFLILIKIILAECAQCTFSNLKLCKREWSPFLYSPIKYM